MENDGWVDCPERKCGKRNLFRIARRGNELGIWVWCRNCKAEKWFSIDTIIAIAGSDIVRTREKTSELTREF